MEEGRRLRLKDKVAIITGAARGIGKAVAMTFADEGCNAAICDIDAELLFETQKEIEAKKTKIIAAVVDVVDRKSVFNFCDQAIKDLGKVDILVNNAGNSMPEVLHKMTEEQWDKVIAVHLKGTFNFTQGVVEHMMRRKYGKIICVTSRAGLTGITWVDKDGVARGGGVNYSTAKAGIIGFTKCAARELAPYNINVNCISPQAMTRMNEALSMEPSIYEEYRRRVPLGRFGEPEEISHYFVFLASDESRYMTGHTLVVSGGTVMM